MRILLTGKSSFTGRTLLPMLEDSGHEVFTLVRDEKKTDHDFVWNFSNPLPLNIPHFDILVHLAAHVGFGKDMEIISYRVNTVATMALAAQAQRHNAYFILASTIGVHGTEHEFINENTPISPSTHYAMSKYLAEETIRSFGIPHSILRITGIYGLDGPSHLGINQAISGAFYQRKRPLLRGSGRSKRNYICVRDVAFWIMQLITLYETKGCPSCSPRETFYLAGPEVMTIEDYLKSVADILLPGQEIERFGDAEGKDMVVQATAFPFEPITFSHYIFSLVEIK